MSNDQLFTAEPPRRGGCGRVLFFGTGCGCLIVCLLCCGVFGTAFYVITRMESGDPVRVVEVRQQIAELDVPEEFTPAQAFDVTIPFADRRFLSWVVYEGRDPQSTLMLAEFNENDTPLDLEAIVAQLETTLRENGIEHEEVEVTESEQLELTIRNQPARFSLARGHLKDDAEQKEYWLVTGTFVGHQAGQAVILLIVDAAEFDRQRIVTFLESIR